MISLTHNLRVIRTEDGVYAVYDANRYLGGIVRHANGTRYRAFGEDFRAISAFTEISGVQLCDP